MGNFQKLQSRVIGKRKSILGSGLVEVRVGIIHDIKYLAVQPLLFYADSQPMLTPPVWMPDRLL